MQQPLQAYSLVTYDRKVKLIDSYQLYLIDIDMQFNVNSTYILKELIVQIIKIIHNQHRKKSIYTKYKYLS